MLGAEGGWSQLAGTKLQQPPSLPGVSWFSRHAEGYGDVPTCPLFPGDTNQAAWGQQVGIRAVSLLCHCGGTPLLPAPWGHSSPKAAAALLLPTFWGPPPPPSLSPALVWALLGPCRAAVAVCLCFFCHHDQKRVLLPSKFPPGEKKPAPGRSRGAASRVRSARKGLQTEGAVSDSSRAWEKCPAFRSRPISVSAPASRASEPRVGSAVPAPRGFARGWGARNTPAWLWGGCG